MTIYRIGQTNIDTTLQYDVLHYDVVHYDVLHYDVVHYDVVHYDVMKMFSTSSGTDGHLIQKQLFVKKGSWQQENWGERKRTRHFPPSKGRQPEVCIATFIQNCIISLLLILVGCAVEKSIA